jgi:hypothetical protein
MLTPAEPEATMTRLSQNAFMLIVAALACAAAFASVVLAYPRTVSNPALGDEWQCRKAMFLTTCARAGGVQPAIHRFRRDADDIRRV